MLSTAETEDEREMRTFEGRVAVVTGGAAGIGAASAPTAVAAAFDALIAAHGRLDVLHANAGVEWTKTVEDTEPQEWAQVIGVNLTGVYTCGRAALTVMKARGSGAI